MGFKTFNYKEDTFIIYFNESRQLLSVELTKKELSSGFLDIFLIHKCLTPALLVVFPIPPLTCALLTIKKCL